MQAYVPTDGVTFEAVKEQLILLGHDIPDSVIRAFLNDGGMQPAGRASDLSASDPAPQLNGVRQDDEKESLTGDKFCADIRDLSDIKEGQAAESLDHWDVSPSGTSCFPEASTVAASFDMHFSQSQLSETDKEGGVPSEEFACEIAASTSKLAAAAADTGARFSTGVSRGYHPADDRLGCPADGASALLRDAMASLDLEQTEGPSIQSHPNTRPSSLEDTLHDRTHEDDEWQQIREEWAALQAVQLSGQHAASVAAADAATSLQLSWSASEASSFNGDAVPSTFTFGGSTAPFADRRAAAAGHVLLEDHRRGGIDASVSGCAEADLCSWARTVHGGDALACAAEEATPFDVDTLGACSATRAEPAAELRGGAGAEPQPTASFGVVPEPLWGDGSLRSGRGSSRGMFGCDAGCRSGVGSIDHGAVRPGVGVAGMAAAAAESYGRAASVGSGQPSEVNTERERHVPWHELLLHAPLYPERVALERLAAGGGRSPRSYGGPNRPPHRGSSGDPSASSARGIGSCREWSPPPERIPSPPRRGREPGAGRRRPDRARAPGRERRAEEWADQNRPLPVPQRSPAAAGSPRWPPGGTPRCIVTSIKGPRKMDRVARWRAVQQAWARDPFLSSGAGGANLQGKRKKMGFREAFAEVHAANDEMRSLYAQLAATL